MEKQTFAFRFRDYGEITVGLVKAADKEEAKSILNAVYGVSCNRVSVMELRFDSHEILELYYGC